MNLNLNFKLLFSILVLYCPKMLHKMYYCGFLNLTLFDLVNWKTYSTLRNNKYIYYRCFIKKTYVLNYEIIRDVLKAFLTLYKH